MEWLQRMNDTINYIEAHITEEINQQRIAQLACCPNYHFQRMFSYITDISLSEYIRRRRLTLAAFELQQSNLSMIDIAQKYGYESHAAFTRAFGELHGIAPSTARKSGAKLKAYPRISFQAAMLGGAEINYRIEHRGSFSAVGIKFRVGTNQANGEIPLIWEEIRRNGLASTLLDLADKPSGKGLGGILGICSDGDWGRNDEFMYYTAVSSEKEPPEGMEKIFFPERWVVTRTNCEPPPKGKLNTGNKNQRMSL